MKASKWLWLARDDRAKNLVRFQKVRADCDPQIINIIDKRIKLMSKRFGVDIVICRWIARISSRIFVDHADAVDNMIAAKQMHTREDR